MPSLLTKRTTITQVTPDRADLIEAVSAFYTCNDLRPFIADKNTLMLVALDGANIVGALMAYIVPSYREAALTLIVDTVLVPDGSKRLKSALLKAALKAAKERNCTIMQYDASYDDGTTDECAKIGGMVSRGFKQRVLWAVR